MMAAARQAVVVVVPCLVWAWSPVAGGTLLVVLLCHAYGTHRITRVPVAMVLFIILLFDLCSYVLVRLCIFAVEASRQRKRREHLMETATDYARWCAAAASLDSSEGRETWCGIAESDLYDWRAVSVTTVRLRDARQAGDAARLMAVLQPCLKPNVFNVCDWRIYCASRTTTKACIEELVDEVCAALSWLSARRGLSDTLTAEWRAFLSAGRASLGNPALLLSGGAMLSIYHFGVIKALLELEMLPTVISGSSGGACVAAFACCFTDAELREVLRRATDEPEASELWREFGSHGPFHGRCFWKMCQLLRQGHIYEWEDFMRHMRWFSKGLTFREAFERTGRVLNVTCTPIRSHGGGCSPPLMLNHIDTPHVDIASAVCASACVPGLIKPAHLMEKGPDGTLRPYHAHQSGESSESRVLLRDGSFESDVPIHQVASHFGMSFAIVAQVNPHIVPFYAHLLGRPGRPSGGRAHTGEWRGGFLFSALEVFFKEGMRAIMRTFQQLRLDWKFFGLDLTHVWLQPLDPHVAGVTLTPDLCLADCRDLIANLPNPSELRRMVRSMERNTWEASALLRTHMRVEAALASAIASLDPSPVDGKGLDAIRYPIPTHIGTHAHACAGVGVGVPPTPQIVCRASHSPNPPHSSMARRSSQE